MDTFVVACHGPAGAGWSTMSVALLLLPYRSPTAVGSTSEPSRTAGAWVPRTTVDQRARSRAVPSKLSERAPKHELFGAATVTDTVAFALAPRLSVTVRVAVKVPATV